ncbi:ribose 5-phosphate isomerase B [Serratia fonticola]|jgi:ribose 5-phosphate isomerase B|uniref:Ribose-5-phosphate isomerase B n=1 Tax=Serratia fonticola TaxID=47917 RepID=A0A0F7HFU2_SERFO|nr:ribose 5-phosphate isomerase B [Serratia fonticola]AKG72239.1 ribose 5-phosphate isomerase [Serratia fonticola]MBC3379570.1 ribose 5-phosphate isomerase B [Serratia fonticola]MEB7885567.1 ribose 5-phosphate isomerase B [Serratia fonticola]NYA38770.1 ribose 5-phosphate isomerase B [Serratia fonticola]CAI0843251.1 Ribose-5-phosphate isomerase B [Serratia fonticola]
MKIAIGCDHVGIILKPTIIEHLKAKGINVIDKGAHGEQRTDYPLYAKAVADAVVSQEADLGILICGSGIGISIAANKVNGIRAVVCSEPYSAKLSRQHNNTNILAFGSRVIGAELAKMIVDEWLNARFEGDRHQKRVEMIAALETQP